VASTLRNYEYQREPPQTRNERPQTETNARVRLDNGKQLHETTRTIELHRKYGIAMCQKHDDARHHRDAARPLFDPI